MYSVGSVFLQVIPSFDGVQRKARAEGERGGKAMSDGFDNGLADIEKGAATRGKNAGKKYTGAFEKTFKDSAKSMKAAYADLGDSASKDLRKVSKDIERISKMKFSPTMDTGDALKSLERVRQVVREARNNGDLDMQIRVNAGAIDEAARKAQESLRAMSGVSLDSVRAQNQLQRDGFLQARAFRENEQRDLAKLHDTEKQIHATQKQAARDELESLRGRRAELDGLLNRVKSGKINIGTQGLARVMAELRALDAQLDRLTGENRRLNLGLGSTLSERMALRRLQESFEDVGKSARRANMAMAAFDAGGAANSVRLFSGALLAIVTVGPMLIPLLAGIGAGILGIGAAAGAAVIGIGAMVFGLAGIGGAVGALGDVDKERRKQQRQGSGAGAAKDTRALENAQRDLARVHEDSGRRIAASLRSQEAAERSLTQAVERAADAQRDLVRARREAAEDLEDINNRMTSGLLAEQQQKYAVEEAAVHLNIVLEDDQATQREKDVAQLSYDQAAQSLKELQLANRRLAVEVADANKKGVEGSKVVADAKQDIIDADIEVRDAQIQLGLAAEETARARVEEARTIADAQRRVAEAMVDLQAKTVEAGVAGSSAMDNLRESMLGLSPAGQEFARFLYGLKPLLDQIRFAAQEGFLPGLQQAIQMIVDAYGPKFVTFIGVMAKVLGDLAVSFAEMFTNPFWVQFFDYMAEVAPDFLRQWGEITMSLLTFVAAVLQAFTPLGQELMTFLVDIAAGMAAWATSTAGMDAMATFIDYVRESGPKVWELLVLIFEVIGKLLVGLAPYADKLIELAISFFGYLAGMKPEDLAKIALAFIAIVGSIQILAGLMSAFGSVVGLLGSLAAVGPIVGIVALAIAGFVIQMAAWGTAMYLLRDQISSVFGAIGEAATWAWENVLKPIWDAMVFVWQQILAPAFTWLYESIIKPVWDLIVAVFQVGWSVISVIFNMIDQIIRFVIAPVFNWLYDNVIKPVWDKIKPVFEAMGAFIRDHVAPVFQAGLEIISGLWNGLLDMLRAPIRLGLELVINKGLIGAFNWLAEKVPGMTKIDEIPIPAALQPGGGSPARGGSGGRQQMAADGKVLDGYTPGRDVHRFWSPTGGTLDLSGGEGVLRPELTSAIGKSRWDAANKKARAGDIPGGLAALGIPTGPVQALKSGGWWENLMAGAGRAGGNAVGWLRDRGSDVYDAASAAKNALTDPAGLLRGVVKGLAEDNGIGGFLGDAVTAVALSPIDKIADWVKSTIAASPEAGAEGPGWNPAGGGLGWQRMFQLVSAGVPGTRLNSAYRPGAITALGTPSMHGAGRAVDLTPSMAVFNWIKSNFPESKEIIFSPAGAGQVYKGKNILYGEPTRGDHWDHVHWGYDKGGIIGDAANLYDTGGDLPPGLTLALNKTGKTEHVLTDRMMQDIKNTRGGDTIFAGDIIGYTPEELIKAANDERRRTEAAFGFTQIEEMVL